VRSGPVAALGQALDEIKRLRCRSYDCSAPMGQVLKCLTNHIRR
jgi:hypothetical protein